MARRAEAPAIFTDNIDRFIGRILAATAGVLVAFLVIVQLWKLVAR